MHCFFRCGLCVFWRVPSLFRLSFDYLPCKCNTRSMYGTSLHVCDPYRYACLVLYILFCHKCI